MLVVSNSVYDAFQNILRFEQQYMKRGRIMLITGNPHTQTGNGKTSAAAAVGCITDPNYSAERHEFRIKPYLSNVKNSFETAKKSRRYYQTNTLDEGQLSIPSTEWYTVSSKAMLATSSLQRKARGLSIINTPHWGFVLKSVRWLVNLWAYPDTEYDARTNSLTGKLKVFGLNKDTWTEKVTTHQLCVYSKEENAPTWIDAFYYGLPPSDIMNAIDEKDDYFKSEYMDDAHASAEAYEQRVIKQEAKSPFEIAEELIKLPEVDVEWKKRKKIGSGLVTYLDRTISTTKATTVARIINYKLKKEQDLKEEAASKNG